jgi:hypothetical protein
MILVRNIKSKGEVVAAPPPLHCAVEEERLAMYVQEGSIALFT